MSYELWANVVIGVGQLFSSWYGVKHDQEIHRKELATSMATHFQTLSQDLFAAAKEADRDVWEQNNDRFNNLMIITVLMLGITSSLVTDGSFNASNASQDFELAFLITTSAALACYIGSLSAAIRATRDMSVLMTERSARLERRIIQLTSQNGGLSGQMRRLYASRDEADPGLVEGENESFNTFVERNESFNTFVERKIKPLETRARNFFLMGTLCSMVAMAMLVSTDFSSVGATMFAVISVVGGFIFAIWSAHEFCVTPDPRPVLRPVQAAPPAPPPPARVDLQNEIVRDVRREDIPRCEVPLL